MTGHDRKKLLTTNAAIWAMVGLLAFVLPFVADSLTEGRPGFLKMLLHIGLVSTGLFLSNAAITKAVGSASEASGD